MLPTCVVSVTENMIWGSLMGVVNWAGLGGCHDDDQLFQLMTNFFNEDDQLFGVSFKCFT